MLKFLAIAAALAIGTSANAATFTVFATDNIFAAGNAVAPILPHGGGTLPSFINVSAGQTVKVTATGSIDCCSGSSYNGPAGRGGISNITNTLGNGIGNYSGATFALAGVFTGGASSIPFTVGVGGNFLVPTGATKFYFGIPDAFGFNGDVDYYFDNNGSFSVTTSVPEPASWALMIVGFGLVGATMRRRQGLAVA